MARRGQPVPNGAQSRARDRLNAIATRPRGSSARAQPQGGGAVPGVFEELLAEASDEPIPTAQHVRPSKRRRVAGRDTTPGRDAARHQDAQPSNPATSSPEVNRQTVVISSDDSQDNDDFEDWEQVPLESQQVPTTAAPASLARTDSQDITDVSVAVGTHTSPSANRNVRRKIITNAERAIRLATHKTHLLFLLFHLHVRNAWCNNKKVEVFYRARHTRSGH